MCVDVCVAVDLFLCFFFFKQKTAYEMRISDWSSDVCSSDLCHGPTGAGVSPAAFPRIGGQHSVYVASRLKMYRDDSKSALPDGTHKIMAEVAAKLSDEEIAALASYVNGLQ